MFVQSLGVSRRENAKVRVLSINAPPHTAVMLRESGASSIPEPPVLETRSCGVLDTPPKPVIGRAFARPVGGV
jgi:hypothetical protein